MPIKKIDKQQAEDPKPEELHDFYEAYYSQEVKIRFDKLKIVNLLRQLGFYRYDVPDSQQSEMVRIIDNKIRLVKMKDIRDAFEDYLRGLPNMEYTFIRKVTQEDGTVEYEPFKYTITPNFLIRRMYDNLSLLFSNDLMERLRPLDKTIETQEDTREVKYIYFNNTVLEISGAGIKRTDYKDLSGYIWENSIINRDYTEDFAVGDFETFVGDICKYDPRDTDDKMRYLGELRKRSLMSILGYLMHNNYETNLKAILFTDVNDDGMGQAMGGTGKGLLGKALANILNRNNGDCRYISIAGKSFEFKDTRYSMGDLTTQLIHIEDLGERFSFKDLYNDVTDGCLFRKLHHDPQTHFTKMMLSVNHTIEFGGTSDKRRLVIFELYNYYNEQRTPELKFGKRFFESTWSKDDWAQFDCFMVRCMQTYMQYGLIQPDMINYENRLLEEKLPKEFIAYFEDWIKQAVVSGQRTEFSKQKMWEGMTAQYNDFYKYGRRKFTSWCYTYLTLKHIPSAAVRKSGKSEDDMLVLYPKYPELYSKTEYIYKEKQ